MGKDAAQINYGRGSPVSDSALLCGHSFVFPVLLHVGIASRVSFYLHSWNYCNLKSKKCGKTYGFANEIEIKEQMGSW